ncbi:hypothetical protein [Arthrobacter sp. AZCC_0090]|uniref:hypothetical protein n=1 Tax=Arthrobacter sp. AZCC_0090 TaxID=2735881 RepID=UPI0016170C5F|nr:hypothetical protein [Arthrobacter sp. AZCC_0090]MBB6404363.1 hypothetical protein [Arthrobacter sp. AZCC_0090]
MYGNSLTTGGAVAGGGTLALTGAPVLGWAILLGVALLVTGFVILRNSRLKTAQRSAGRKHS